jgi:hypothetical protein
MILSDLEIAKKYINIQQSAQKRNLEFNLSLKDIKRLLKTKKCFYTGNELNHIIGDENQLSIDRIDNNKGYVVGNVVACSSKFNMIKSCLTINDVKLLVNAFKKKKIWSN